MLICYVALLIIEYSSSKLSTYLSNRRLILKTLDSLTTVANHSEDLQKQVYDEEEDFSA